MENVLVCVHAISYWHRFKSWPKTPVWAQDRALLLVAALNDRGDSVIPGIGHAVVRNSDVISVTLYTKEYGGVIDG